MAARRKQQRITKEDLQAGFAARLGTVPVHQRAVCVEFCPRCVFGKGEHATEVGTLVK